MNRPIIAALALLFFLLTDAAAAEKNYAEVVKVIDGDTIEIEDGERVRYIGIDTPELNLGKDGKRPECYAREAALKNHELVYGKRIAMESDVRDRDKYGRLLRYIYVDDVRINDELVRSGYAKAYLFPDDRKYAEEITAAQTEAKKNSAGMWTECADNKRQKEAESRWNELAARIRKLKNLVAELFNPRRVRCVAGDC